MIYYSLGGIKELPGKENIIMKKEYRVIWQLWNENEEAYEMRPATCVIHNTKEAARRERAEMLEDPQYAGDTCYFCGSGDYKFCPNCGAEMEIIKYE